MITDRLGTTRAVSDQQAAVSQTAVYTSFGEKIDDSLETRYGYVGAYGYESFSSLTSSVSPLTSRLQHVGHRTYDPALGRFLQRDPIGIMGGLNVYEYVGSDPQSYIDPLGLLPFGGLEKQSQYWGYRSSGLSPSESIDRMQRDAEAESKFWGDFVRGAIDGIVPYFNPLKPSDPGWGYDAGTFTGEWCSTLIPYAAGYKLILKGPKWLQRSYRIARVVYRKIDRALRPFPPHY